MQFIFKTIAIWPRKPTATRQRSRFDSTYRDTLELLERELRQISARQPVIIQTYMDERDIRNDGLPRSDARAPGNPGVIVTLERWIPNGKRNEQGKPLGVVTPFSFPCDQFTDWKDNLRAIALALEALRKVDRYGVTQNAEQYTGWKALPASGGLQSDEEAARTLCEFGALNGRVNPQSVLSDPEIAKQAFRAAAKATHTDTGGKQADFQAVQIAWGRLKERHKLK